MRFTFVAFMAIIGSALAADKAPALVRLNKMNINTIEANQSSDWRQIPLQSRWQLRKLC